MEDYIQRLNKQDPNLLARVFIAIMFPEAMRVRLFEHISKIKALHHHAPLRWTAPENWHLTLAFLGKITEHQRDELLLALSQTAKAHSRLQLHFSLADGFPFSASSHSLVLYPEQNEALMKLQSSIASECKRLQLPFETTLAFKPHVTIARRQRGKTLSPKPYYFLSPLMLEVDSYALVSSKPETIRSRYETIETFILNKK